MNRTISSLVLLAASLCAACRAAESDRLAEALATVGYTKADLGYRPKGYWSRFPDPARVPHKLHFFDSLFAEPLRTYDFTLGMAQSVRDLLSVEQLDKKDDSLFRLLYFLGIEHKVGVFRGYSANLDAQPAGESPLVDAVGRLYAAAGQDLRIVVFGKKADWPDPEAQIKEAAEALDPELERILAVLVLNVVDAARWRDLALRNVDASDLAAVFAMRSFHGHSSDGQSYPHQVDDVVRELDEASLYYAAQKAAQAAHDAARSLRAYVAATTNSLDGLAVDIATPLGRIALGGTGTNRYSAEAYAVLIDLGGNDVYEGSVGATVSPSQPIAVAIDLAGDDVYRCTREGAIAQGAGVFGAGVLLDLAGNDTYATPSYHYGPYSLYGDSLGVLLDIGGKDQYLDWDFGKGEGTPVDGVGDNTTWFKPARDDEHYGHRSFGIGHDVESGTVPDLFIYAEREGAE